MTDCAFSLASLRDDVPKDGRSLSFLRLVQAGIERVGLPEAVFGRKPRVTTEPMNLVKMAVLTFDATVPGSEAWRHEMPKDGHTEIGLLASNATLDPGGIVAAWIRSGGIFFRMKDRIEIVHLPNPGSTGHEILAAQADFSEAHPEFART